MAVKRRALQPGGRRGASSASLLPVGSASRYSRKLFPCRQSRARARAASRELGGNQWPTARRTLPGRLSPGRPQGAGHVAGAGRAVRRAHAQRSRRRRGQGRAAGRRYHPAVGQGGRRRARLLPPAERRQAQHLRRPARPGRAGTGAGAGAPGRHPDRELPARRHAAAGPRLRGAAGGQSAPDHAVDLRLRPRRAGIAATGLRARSSMPKSA